MAPLRILVLDAYAPEGRAALCDAGGTEAGRLYLRMLQRADPSARVEIAYPADGNDELPDRRELDRFDGVAWTGSSLTIHDADDRRVTRQIDFARDVFTAGVPSFGSCWAAQLAVVAAGGQCAPHPRGREFGISRRIALSDAGRSHAVYAGKPPVFDAFTSHQDHITAVGPARCLASNDWSPVQAVDVEHANGWFWAVQYHPEYDPHEVASLCRLRRTELVAQGSFPDNDAVARFIDDLEALQHDPDDSERARAIGIEGGLLDRDVREIEAHNWIGRLHELGCQADSARPDPTRGKPEH